MLTPARRSPRAPGPPRRPSCTWYVRLSFGLRLLARSTSDQSYTYTRPSRTTTAQLDKVRQGKFYILCPDNETRKQVDQLRIMWGAGDVAEGRPALSRWHRDYKALFEEYVRDGLESLD